MEESVNVKTRLVLIPFFAGLAIGFASGFAGWRIRVDAESSSLGAHLEQVNRDLDGIVSAQREIAGRASGLQAELSGIRDSAENIERGAGQITKRSENLADRLDGIVINSGELTYRIEQAESSIAESRILLDELGTILRGISASIADENAQP